MKKSKLFKTLKICLVACLVLATTIIPTYAQTGIEGKFYYTKINVDDDMLEFGGCFTYDGIDYDSIILTADGCELMCADYNTILTIGDYIDVQWFEYGDEDAFLRYFSTEMLSESFNIYGSCYDLVNTYVYGGTVTEGTYQDLVCISVATFLCLFIVALPFLAVFGFLKVWL